MTRGAARRAGETVASVAAPTRSAGQGLAEYALFLALVVAVAILALAFFGGQTSGVLNTVSGGV